MVSIEIPKALVFEISQTAPGIKGASATARTKPATLSTWQAFVHLPPAFLALYPNLLSSSTKRSLWSP
jgi:hypothetical protein